MKKSGNNSIRKGKGRGCYAPSVILDITNVFGIAKSKQTMGMLLRKRIELEICNFYVTRKSRVLRFQLRWIRVALGGRIRTFTVVFGDGGLSEMNIEKLSDVCG